MLKKLVLFLLVVLIAVVVFCNFYMGSVITKVINSEGPKALKTDVRVQNIALNVLGGSLDINSLQVNNPAGSDEKVLFSLQRGFADLGVMKLLTEKKIEVENLLIKDANLYIVKSRDGKINLQEMINNLSSGKTAEPAKTEAKPEAQPEQKPAAAGAMPQALLKTLNISTALDFIDYSLKEKFNVGFELKITADNIATYGNAEEMSGTVKITGNMKEKPTLFAVNADMKIAPVVDPAKPTFDLTAKISNIDMSVFAVYSAQTKVKKGKMEIASRVVCRKGVFDKTLSIQKVSIKELELDPSATGKNVPADAVPQELSFECPLGGTLEKPEIDFVQVLNKIIMDQLLNPANLLKNQKNINNLISGSKEQKGAMLNNLLGGKAPATTGGAQESGAAASAPAADSKTSAVQGLLGGGAASAPAAGQTSSAGSGEQQQTKQSSAKDGVGGLLGGNAKKLGF